MSTWRERTLALRSSITRAQAVRDRLTEERVSKQAEVAALTQRMEIVTKAGEALRALMDKMVFDQVASIEAVVTEGLRAVFPHYNLTFEAEVGAKYNKIAIDFFIKQGADDQAIRGSPLESFGGGPASIASLILRVLALLRLKRFPLLFLDESLAAVSDDDIDAAGRFVAKLAESAGIDILLVTHKAAFLDHATQALQGYEDANEDGSWRLGLRRIRG